MVDNKIDFKYFAREEDFVKRLKFIRAYFGPEARNTLNGNFEFKNGVTRQEVLELYNRELEKYRRYNLRVKLTPKPLRQYVPAILWYNEEYRTLISLMDVLGVDKIDTKELDHVLNNSRPYFIAYFDENLKSVEKEEME